MRSKEMQKFVDAMAQDMFGISHTDAQNQGVCVTCGTSVVGEFRDALSAKEYRISGMCQECQDNFFGS